MLLQVQHFISNNKKGGKWCVTERVLLNDSSYFWLEFNEIQKRNTRRVNQPSYVVLRIPKQYYPGKITTRED